MHKVPLGGARLGSGKKNDVELHAYERSNHNQSKMVRTTMSAGTIVPFYFNLLLPGTTIDIDADVDVKTHPAEGPLFGTFKTQGDFFTLPVRLYQQRMHNNPLEVGYEMENVKLPLMTLYATAVDPDTVTDIDNAQINPSCILKYIGISGVGLHNEDTIQTRDFHAIKLLGYWDVVKNYYSNKQEKIGGVIHNIRAAVTENLSTIDAVSGNNSNPFPQKPGTIAMLMGLPYAESKFDITVSAGVLHPEEIIILTSRGSYPLSELGLLTGTGLNYTLEWDSQKFPYTYVHNWDYIQDTEMPFGAPEVVTFPLTNIDAMRKYILTHLSDNVAVNINSADLSPYNLLLELQESTKTSYLNSQEGLAVKTYQSDIFNNWLDTEFMGSIAQMTAIDTSGGSFTMDTLLMQKKLYMMMNRVAIMDGSLQGWIQAVYNHTSSWKAETPVFHGGFTKELGFQEIFSNAESTGPNGPSPLGQLAGKGEMFGKLKGGKVRITVDEPTWVMGCFSITPRIDYSQGNDWDVHLKTVNDFHKPGLDGIGFEDLNTEQMAWWDTQYDPVAEEWVSHSAGKVPAWINYRTAYNQCYGNFAIPNNEMFMTLNRRYEWNGAVTPVSQIKDLTTYIDPVKSNNVFSQTSRDAQNFWVQIAMQITTRRKMSARDIPYL